MKAVQVLTLAVFLLVFGAVTVQARLTRGQVDKAIDSMEWVKSVIESHVIEDLATGKYVLSDSIKNHIIETKKSLDGKLDRQFNDLLNNTQTKKEVLIKQTKFHHNVLLRGLKSIRMRLPEDAEDIPNVPLPPEKPTKPEVVPEVAVETSAVPLPTSKPGLDLLDVAETSAVPLPTSKPEAGPEVVETNEVPAGDGGNQVADGSRTYTVKKGDSIWKIAKAISKELGISTNELVKVITSINCLGKGNNIYPGQVIKLPSAELKEEQVEEFVKTNGAEAGTQKYSERVLTEVKEALFAVNDALWPLVGSRDEEACKTKLSMLGNQALIEYYASITKVKQMARGGFREEAVRYCKRLKEFAQAAEKAQFVFTHNTVGHLLTITTLRPNI